MVTTLKQLLDQNTPVVAPGVMDGISALLVRELGFQAAYLGSFSVTSIKYGLPDIGFVGLEDMADTVRRLAPLIGGPLIVDGEGGFGNAIHVARSVRILERAGASATHIEDHLFGKHLGVPQVLPVSQAVDKIKAALDARESEDFLIIARSDAEQGEGVDAAVDRLLAYEEAGADALFLARAVKAGDVINERLRAESRLPIVSTNGPGTGYTAADLGAQGADIVLWPTVANLASMAGIRAVFEAIAQEGTTKRVDHLLGTNAAYEDFLGSPRYREEAERLGLLS